MLTRIYTMTHKKFEVPHSSTYIPMHVGAWNKEDLGYLWDSTGDNISSLNPYFAELTGMYWVWKNVKDCDIVGICHYRRYPVNDLNQGMSANEYEDILEKYDLITSKLLELPNPYYYGFEQNHNIRDLNCVGNAIKELYPEDYKLYEEIVHGNRTYFGNIIVARKALYDEYCNWLFPIFFKVHSEIGLYLDEYDNYHKRVYGFISEILLLVWVRSRNLNPYECKIGMLGEKKETAELKSDLAKYFKEHNHKKAQEYFENVLKSRPDVTMEASDITGELKICMQIISTCNFEEADGKKTVLEYVDDYSDLIKMFSNINRMVAGKRLDKSVIAEMFGGYIISDEAVYVAEKIYCN